MLVIHNAKIYTLDPDRVSGSALAIDNGRIIAIGTDDEVITSFSTRNLFNAGGNTIIPGLTDAHIHLENYALSLHKVDCETKSLGECLRRLSDICCILHTRRLDPWSWLEPKQLA